MKTAHLVLLAVAFARLVWPATSAAAQTSFAEHPPISTNATGAAGLVSADIDSDGHTDVVTAEYGNNTVAWYENDGGAPPAWTKHVIDGFAAGPITVAVADFDSDGDTDVLAATFNEEGVIWYQNNGASPPAWTKRTVSWANGAWAAHAADIDGDGDMDGVAGVRVDVQSHVGVEWYENNGATPPTFTIRRVSEGFVDSASVYATDMDGDGDGDILSVDVFRDSVYLYENDGATPPGWTRRVVTSGANEPWSVFAADMDGDGDKDVLSASGEDDTIAWYENDGGHPAAWTAHTITTAADLALGVHAADLDGDGDLDAISITWAGPVSWYENVGGSPPVFTAHLVGQCPGGEGLWAARVDGDADTDILCAGNPSAKIFWYENRSGGGPSGCTTDTQCGDGLFCNGVEACVSGSCRPGPLPCTFPALCRESDDRCVSCVSNAACDDGLFCNGVETCGPAGTCLAGSNPCPGLSCNETSDACSGGSELWLSFVDSAAVPGVGVVASQDVVARNAVTGAWSMVFDGSDVGLSALVIDGLARMPDGSLLLSFTAPTNIPGMTGGPSSTALDDSDIVRFVPTSLGPNTAGSFVFYFDGSDVGLTTDNEDVDAIALTPAGQLLISTVGPVSANGVSAADTDVLLFNATSLGSATAGSFALRFDGSDVGLADNGNEDVDAVAVLPSSALLLSTTGSFSVPGLSGADEDVVQFAPTTLGGTTAGTYSMHLDLSALGIDPSEDVGSLEIKE